MNPPRCTRRSGSAPQGEKNLRYPFVRKKFRPVVLTFVEAKPTRHLVVAIATCSANWSLPYRCAIAIMSAGLSDSGL